MSIKDDTGSIHEDELVTTADDGEEFDAADAFLKALDLSEDDPEEVLSETGEKAPTETGEEEPSVDGEDEPEFEVKVGEETRKAKLSELTRLYGQEAALTQKAQALAEVRAKVDVDSARATTALTTQTERAQKAWEPYSKLDFLALSTQMESADFVQLRAEAQAALANVNFFTQELDGLQKATAERTSAANTERAQAAIAELTDPVKGIKGWGKDLHEELVKYGEANGMKDARALLDAAPFRILHKAMLADRAASKVVDVKKVVSKATVVMKPGAKASVADKGSYKSALQNMRNNGGNHDSTAAAFEALDRR